MARRTFDVVYIIEILVHWHAGRSNSEIAQSLDVDRKAEAGSFEVEEEYSCDASGIVKVTISNRSAAYRREYTLGRWSAVRRRR